MRFSPPQRVVVVGAGAVGLRSLPPIGGAHPKSTMKESAMSQGSGSQQPSVIEDLADLASVRPRRHFGQPDFLESIRFSRTPSISSRAAVADGHIDNLRASHHVPATSVRSRSGLAVIP